MRRVEIDGGAAQLQITSVGLSAPALARPTAAERGGVVQKAFPASLELAGLVGHACCSAGATSR
jgi:hypothetical protein